LRPNVVRWEEVGHGNAAPSYLVSMMYDMRYSRGGRLGYVSTRARQTKWRCYIMKKVYIHIGHGKTGTSSIQMALSRNQEALHSQGIYYPLRNKGSINHHILAPFCIDSLSKDIIGLYDEFIGLFLASDCHTLILSSEQFTYCRPRIIEQIGEIFSPFDVKIIYFARCQSQLIKSAYMQHLKQEKPTTPESLSEYAEKNRYAFMHTRRVKNWASVFGRKAINAYCYSSKISSIDVFTNALNLVDILPVADIRSNPSVPLIYAPMINSFDRCVDVPEARNKLIAEILNFSQAPVEHLAPNVNTLLERTRLLASRHHKSGPYLEAYILEEENLRRILTGTAKTLNPVVNDDIDNFYLSDNWEFANLYMSDTDKKLFLA
jgi:hypothetical protein